MTANLNIKPDIKLSVKQTFGKCGKGKVTTGEGKAAIGKGKAATVKGFSNFGKGSFPRKGVVCNWERFHQF